MKVERIIQLNLSARLCDYADCRKPLHTVLQCAKCKGVAYCTKDCQVCSPPPCWPLAQETGRWHACFRHTHNMRACVHWMPRRTHAFSLGCPTSCLLLTAPVCMEVHVTLPLSPLHTLVTHTTDSLTHTTRSNPPLSFSNPDPFSLAARSRRGRPGTRASARASARTAAKPTADQMRLLEILEQLAVAADWRGVVAQERAARAVAAAVGASIPYYAFVCPLRPRQRVSFAGSLFQGHRVPHAAPGDCKGTQCIELNAVTSTPQWIKV